MNHVNEALGRGNEVNIRGVCSTQESSPVSRQLVSRWHAQKTIGHNLGN